MFAFRCLSCSAAFLWPPYKPTTFHQLPAFEQFDLDVVELLAAVRGDVAFFIEKEETTRFQFVADSIGLNFADGLTVEPWRFHNAVSESVIRIQIFEAIKPTL